MARTGEAVNTSCKCSKRRSFRDKKASGDLDTTFLYKQDERRTEDHEQKVWSGCGRTLEMRHHMFGCPLSKTIQLQIHTNVSKDGRAAIDRSETIESDP